MSPYIQDTTVVNVTIWDEVVTAGIKEESVRAAHTGPMIKYLMEKYGWSNQIE